MYSLSIPYQRQVACIKFALVWIGEIAVDKHPLETKLYLLVSDVRPKRVGSTYISLSLAVRIIFLSDSIIRSSHFDRPICVFIAAQMSTPKPK